MPNEIPRLTMTHEQGYDCFNPAGMEFGKAVGAALEPVFAEWVKKGYNVYDLMGIAHSEISMVPINILVQEVIQEEKNT